MKDSAWYNKLWQNKMLQLPVKEDESNAWNKMQAMLDKNMPVEAPVAIEKPANNATIAIIAIIVIIIAAILLYFTLSYKPGDHHKTNNGLINKSTSSAGFKSDKNHATSGIGNANSAPNPASANRESQDNNKPGTNTSSPQTKKSNLVLDGSPAIPNANNQKVTGKNTAPQTTNTKPLKQYNTAIKTTMNNGKRGKNNANKSTAYNSYGSKHSRRNLNPSYPQTGHQPQNRDRLSASNRAGSNSLVQNGIKNNVDPSKSTSANGDVNSSPTSVQKNNNPAPGNIVNNAVNTSKGGSIDTQQMAVNNAAKNKTVILTGKNKTALVKKPKGNSKFEVDVKIGANSNGSFTAANQNSNFYGKAQVDAFLGINVAYHFNPLWSVSIGVNALSPKLISGSYSTNNLKYTTVGDTGKIIIHNTGKVTIHGSGKIHVIDIPVFATYKFNNNLSFIGGPVIGIPVKHEALKTNLSLLTNSTDTTAAKEVIPYASSTTMTNNVSLSLSAGVRLNFNRFFIDGTYMQGITPCTISSALGSEKIYYHTIQVGIGFQLFKPKGK